MTNSKFLLLTAALMLALGFTLSCSNDNDSDPAISSSGNEQSVSSSSWRGSSSSSDCLPLNNYNMAVEINLNSEPVVVVKNGSVLIEGVNYKVSTTQNSIKVNGIYDYIGSVEHASSGSSGIVVKDGDKVLAENIDYAIIEAGNSVKIAGIGNYTGSVEVELPCETPTEPPAEGMMYWGHAANNDTEILVEWFDWHISEGMVESSSIIGDVKEIRFPAGSGYRMILIPQSAGMPTRIDDAIGNNVKETVFVPVSNLIVNEIPYYLLISAGTVMDVNGFNLTIRW